MRGSSEEPVHLIWDLRKDFGFRFRVVGFGLWVEGLGFSGFSGGLGFSGFSGGIVPWSLTMSLKRALLIHPIQIKGPYIRTLQRR